MKLSPLQLLHSHFTTVSIIAKEEVTSEVSEESGAQYPKVLGSDVVTEVTLGVPDDENDPHQFVVKLGVSSNTDANASIPYRFAVQMEGIFEIEHDGTMEERTRLVVINGASMLFGSIREQSLTLTSRHKHGPLLLPSLDFRSLGPEPESEPAENVRKSPEKKPISRKPKAGKPEST